MAVGATTPVARAQQVLALGEEYRPRLVGQWFAEARAFARDIIALAAALAAAEERADTEEAKARTYADAARFHKRACETAEERAQAAENEIERTHEGMAHWLAAANTAEAQVRELREALGRAVLARSAGRAET